MFTMIHKFTLFNQYFVLDVNSGTVLCVDKLTYDVLDLYQDGIFCAQDADKLPYEEADILEVRSEIDSLIKEGLLFSPDWHAEIDINKKESVVKALCLHIAHDCNLACAYCFADKGHYGDEGKKRMSPEVGKKAIDYVIRASGNRRNIEIDFFGGEPLLGFDVVKEIVAYAEAEGKKHGKTFRFTITTNGILLSDEVKAYINEHMSNVVLSIDGKKETNDRMRVRLDGSGTYEAIVPKFQSLAESRGQDNYYVRGTYTAHNLHFCDDVLHLADLGFKQVSVEPAISAPDVPYALLEEHLPILFAEYEKLAEAMRQREAEGRGFNFFHFMIDIEGGPCAIKRISGCGAGHEYLAVTPDGALYPCHQFVGEADMCIGNVEDGITKPAMRDEFMHQNLYAHKACRECWAKFYCSGGCAAAAKKYGGGEPFDLACQLEKKRVECAIALKYAK